MIFIVWTPLENQKSLFHYLCLLFVLLPFPPIYLNPCWRWTEMSHCNKTTNRSLCLQSVQTTSSLIDYTDPTCRPWMVCTDEHEREKEVLEQISIKMCRWKCRENIVDQETNRFLSPSVARSFLTDGQDCTNSALKNSQDQKTGSDHRNLFCRWVNNKRIKVSKTAPPGDEGWTIFAVFELIEKVSCVSFTFCPDLGMGSPYAHRNRQIIIKNRKTRFTISLWPHSAETSLTVLINRIQSSYWGINC